MIGRMVTSRFAAALLPTLLSLALAGCPEDDPGGEADAGGRDAGHDAGRDAAPPSDGGVDASGDGGVDAGGDGGLDAGAQVAGLPCTSDDDCAGALVCLHVLGSGDFGVKLPAGYCGRLCTSDDCPSGSACQPFGGASYCLQACSEGTDCRTAEGYLCDTLTDGGSSSCVPAFGGDPDGGTRHVSCDGG